MGLDQYAYKRKVKWNKDHTKNTTTNEQIMYWRKHSKLQQWYCDRFERDSGEVYLQEDDIKELQELTKNGDMPFCDGGLFWGDQYQDDKDWVKECKKDTLEFCKKALKSLKEGYYVVYDCSW